jgi:type II secretory pathway pseudopilin PulG
MLIRRLAGQTGIMTVCPTNMRVDTKQFNKSRTAAMTLVEVVIAMAILAMTMAGLIYGYVQVDRLADWNSMSLAAQSVASEGSEQARAAQWNSEATTNGPGTEDELPPTTNSLGVATNMIFGIATNYIPQTGGVLLLTNYLSVSVVTNNPPLREIKSFCIWTFPRTGTTYTNTVILQRAPDE